MSEPSRAPRIHDVAKLAGVSTATVSRVLSKPEVVTEATRKAVEDAIAATGYIVNITARNLRQRQVGGVLALVPNIANPFFSEILSGIARVLRPRGLNLLVVDTHAAPGEGPDASLSSYLNRARCDGVIVLDGALNAQLFTAPGCPPVVQACEWIDGLEAPRILADNITGGRLVAEHLIGLGHRRILHLGGPPGNTLTISRREGFVAALRDAGLEAEAQDPALRAEGDFSVRSGHTAALRIAQMDERPTAVFCDSDEMALGLLQGLAMNGLRVPDDVSVVGFDNIEMSAYALPPLTTVRQRRGRLGGTAAETLLAMIEGKETQAVETVLPVDLLVRDSTKQLELPTD